MLSHIKGRLASGRPRPQLQAHTAARNVCLIGEATGRLKWVQPSGTKLIHTSFQQSNADFRAASWLASRHVLRNPVSSGHVNERSAPCRLLVRTLMPSWVSHKCCLLCTGPRRPGEGTENEDQGIVTADSTPHG